MTRDEYIEANWQRFADRGPPAGDWPESVARSRAGERWDASRTPRAIVSQWALRRTLSTFLGPLLLGRGPTSEMLLWAVALELDEQLPPTRTGEMVCRFCSGWGWEVVALDQGRFIDPGFMAQARRRSAGILESVGPPPGHHPASGVRVRIAMARCVCSGGVRTEDRRRAVFRPHTVQLHRIVETIAAMRSPMVDDWPEQWLVDIDRREAAGGRSPMAVWWAQFFAWTRGAEVDEQALADALEQLTPARRSTMRVTGGTAVGELGLDISTPWSNDDLGSHLLAPARDQLRREMIGAFPPPTGTSADVLAAVRHWLASEGVRVTGLRSRRVGVGHVHISYDPAQLGTDYATLLEAAREAAREAAPASVHVTAGARLGQVRGHRHAQVVIDEIMYDATHPRSEWPFLDP